MLRVPAQPSPAQPSYALATLGTNIATPRQGARGGYFGAGLVRGGYMLMVEAGECPLAWRGSVVVVVQAGHS